MPNDLIQPDAQPLQNPGADILAPLASRALFWRSRYLEPSPVLCHVPLLFWLTEAARPRIAVTLGVEDAVPHFALCQAVDKLGLDSLCIGFEPAVGPEAKATDFTHQAAFNEANFADFSQIVQDGTLHESIFSRESKIDLLVVNLPITQALADELDKTWLPQLSERGIIVFLQGGEMPGYSSYLRHLTSVSNIFTCDLETRASVVFYGSEQNDRLQRLANLNGGQSGYLAARNVFARLGELHSNTAKLAFKTRESHIARKQRDEKAAELKKAQTEVAKLRTEFEKLATQYSERSELVAKVQAESFDLSQTVTTLQEALQDSLSKHEQEVGELGEELAQLQERLKCAEAERQDLEDRTAEQKGSLSKYEQEARVLREERNLLQDRLKRAATERQELEKKAAEQKDCLNERYHDIAVLGLELQAKAGEVGELTKQLASFEQELESLRHALAETEQLRDLHAERIRALENSSSWRVTAPLRKFSLMIKPR